MTFTLKQIRYFIAAAEAGKISEAAMDLNVSASAVTEAIKELESQLGVRLKNREKQGVSLTYEGYRFLQHAKNIMMTVEDAQYAMGHQPKNLSGRLNLAVTVTVAGYFISKPLARFQRTFPNIEVSLHEHSRHVIEKKIARGQLDLAVALTSNVSRDPCFETLTLFRSQRRLWLSASHRLNEVGTPTLREVAEEPYIQLLIDEAAQTTHNYWSQHGLRPRVVFRTESVEAVRSLVAAGSGVTILSDMVHRPWSLEGMPVQTKPLYESIPTMDTGLLWNKSRPISPAAQAFIDFCRMEYTSGQK